MVSVQNSLRYLWAFLVTFLSALFLLLIRNFLSTQIVSQLFLLLVGVSAALWGLGPGILTAVESFLFYNFLFIEPYYSLMVHQTKDLISLIVFLGVAVAISQLIGQMRVKSDLATRKELEALRLYELSNALGGYHDTQSVLRKLGELVLETLGARRVVIFLDAANGSDPTQYVFEQIPPGMDSPPNRETDEPNILVPLQAEQSVIGEIRVWLTQETKVIDHKRFLDTCASQTTLALERIRLSELETKSRILEESDRLKTALLSSVSHELRTPLATIKASVSSLRDEGFDWDAEARNELLAAIEEETDQLNQLVGNLLSMSRIEAGVLVPERQWNDLREIIEHVLNKIKLQSHRVRVDVSSDLLLVPVDFILMEQVFNNLISNSVKFSPEGSLITINAVQVDENLQVKVINQGPSVPEEHLERIFEKFHRITMRDKVMGTGLGLSICKGIIEAHKGRIWAENSQDGFSFVILLPIKMDGVLVEESKTE
jgi:two-component system sensor histidine kinase KdpD